MGCHAWRKDLYILKHLDGSLPYLFMFNVYGCFARLYVCAPCAYLMPVEARRLQVSWNWSYRWPLNSRVGARNQAQGLWKIGQCGYSQSHLSSPSIQSLSLSSCWGDGQPLSPRGSPVSNGIIDQCWFWGIQTQVLYPLSHLHHQWTCFEITKM